jgi:hypothetical protein
MKTSFATLKKPLEDSLKSIHQMKKLCLFVLFALWATPSVIAQNLDNLKGQKPLRVSSGFALNSSFYTAEGIENRRAPFAWTLTGSPTLTVYGMSIPFSFSVSNQHRSFQQPFNRIGITPQYKWVKLHAGYSSARFSQYTLAGRQFLGGGIELTPGKWRLGYVQGRFQKAVGFDSVAVANPNQYPSAVPVPAFSRYGYAAKLGFGSSKSFIDLSYLKASDRETSIGIPEKLRTTLRPAENAVIGVNTQVTLFKKLTWAADIGVSAYTRDIRADSVVLPEKFAFIGKFMLPKNSTQVQTAGESSLGYRDKHVGLKVTYRRIDPDFKSMGAFFFQTDMEQWLIAPTVNLMKNKVQLTGSYGWQKNNISQTRSRTTTRTISSAALVLRGGKHFNFNANYSNFGVTMQPRANLNPTNLVDTFRAVQVSQSISVAPSWNFRTQNRLQTFGMTMNYSLLDDLNPQSAYKASMKTWVSNAFYSLNFPQRKMGFNSSLIYQNSKNALTTIQNIGLNAGFQKSFAKDKLSTGVNTGFFRNSAGEQTGKTLQIGGNMTYRLSKKGSVFINAQWQQTTTGSKTFSELFGNSGIGMSF